MTVTTRTSRPATSDPDSARPARDRGERGSTRRTRQVTGAILIAVVAVGGVLRFRAPGGMWLDEAISLDIARLPIDQIGPALRQDGHPPLYYLLLKAWTAILGDSNSAARALSGVASLAALPLVWAAGRRLGGRRTAAVALVLLASSPFAVRYGSEARMYALVTLLVLAGYLAALRALEAPSPVRLVPVAVLTSATILTHYWGVFTVVTAVAMLGVGAWATPRDRRARLRVLASIVVGCLPALLWLPSAAYQAAHTGTPWARSVEPFDATFDTLLDFGGGKWSGGRLVAALLVITLGAALLARPTARWRMDVDLRTVPGVRPEAVLSGGTLLLGLVAAVVASSAFQPRYAAGVLPLVLLVVAVGISRLPHPVLRAGVLAVLVVAGLAGSVRQTTGPRTQGDQVAAELSATAEAQDVVVYCPDQLRPSVERALPDGVDPVSLTYPEGSPAGRINWVDYLDRIESSRPDAFVDRVLGLREGGGRIWLVDAEGYRGFDDACQEVRSELERALGPGTEVVARDKESYESHTLERFDRR